MANIFLIFKVILLTFGPFCLTIGLNGTKFARHRKFLTAQLCSFAEK